MYSDEKIEEFLHSASSNNLSRVQSMIENKEVEINSTDSEQVTALHCSACKGYEKVTEYLLSEGATIEAETINGITPLYAAVQNGQKSIVRILLEKGAKVNVIAGGCTMLQTATMTDKPEMIDLLLGYGVNINDNRGKNGTTALHIAFLEKKHKVANHLLEKGANYRLCSENGYSALHFAAKKDLAGVKLLLDYVKGSIYGEGLQEYVNLQDKEKGWTALHIAAQVKDYYIVEYLLNNKADSKRKDKEGKEAKNYVADSSFVSQQIREFLKKNEKKLDTQLSFSAK